MKALSFKFTSNRMLLCIFLYLLWDVTESTTTLTPESATITTATPPETTIDATTPPLTTFTTTKAPLHNVKSVTVVDQSENTITLQWERVNDVLTYSLEYVKDGDVKNESITLTENNDHTVTDLTAGTLYNFTLFTISDEQTSSGYNFTNFTLPRNAEDFRTVEQNETSITVQWRKVENTDYTLEFNDKIMNFQVMTGEDLVIRTISDLTGMTQYNFTLYTVFQERRSNGTKTTGYTAPPPVEDLQSVAQTENTITLQWKKVGQIDEYIVSYNGTNITDGSDSSMEQVSQTISGLVSGTVYNFSVSAVFQNISSVGEIIRAPTAPRNTQQMKQIGQNETTITLQWEMVDDIVEYILDVNGARKNVTATGKQQQVTGEINNLNSGTGYHVSLLTVFENVISSGFNITAFTAPRNTENIQPIRQDETSITVQWDKVDDFEYKVVVVGQSEEIVHAQGPGRVEHMIIGLTSATKYDIFVFVLLSENITSSGVHRVAATAPPQVPSVRVRRSVTTINLEWDNVCKVCSYIVQLHGDPVQIQANDSTDLVSYPFEGLTPGTVFTVTVTSEFFGLNSTDYEIPTATVIDCSAVPWHVTSSSIKGAVEGMFTNATARNQTQTHVSPKGSNVSFTGLYPGATYDVALMYENINPPILMCEHKLFLPPSNVKAYCENSASGFAMNIKWDNPEGLWTHVEVNVTGKNSVKLRNDGETNVVISGFQPARTYKVTVALLSRSLRSQQPYVFSCLTDARGVIVGSILGVLFFVLICAVAFILLKRPHWIRLRKPLISDSKLSDKKYKAIPVEKFPDHFYKFSSDENRGFSEEYENLLSVGTEQTQRDAVLPDNKPRNRFNNVLPYDWCRVKLDKSNPEDPSDYINASYMPGYNRSREYIATQGPLPSTVKHFWRMVWEQRVKGIVMVTNCTESGRVKCEQYWPADSKPCPYGELVVSVMSVEQEPNWTLRDFRIKNESTAEERTVKHFHFTAWPDHGVPQGTEVLIQFRGLVREHIERDGAGAPTVVHCSAGVGRTGTIMALDVLLQQLQKEKAVGINSFVRKMRLSRPHMVQTESQYVFLHQCIMDTLKPKEKNDENIYENADMIYANATALREFNSNV